MMANGTCFQLSCKCWLLKKSDISPAAWKSEWFYPSKRQRTESTRQRSKRKGKSLRTYEFEKLKPGRNIMNHWKEQNGDWKKKSNIAGLHWIWIIFRSLGLLYEKWITVEKEWTVLFNPIKDMY